MIADKNISHHCSISRSFLDRTWIRFYLFLLASRTTGQNMVRYRKFWCDWNLKSISFSGFKIVDTKQNENSYSVKSMRRQILVMPQSLYSSTKIMRSQTSGQQRHLSLVFHITNRLWWFHQSISNYETEQDPIIFIHVHRCFCFVNGCCLFVCVRVRLNLFVFQSISLSNRVSSLNLSLVIRKRGTRLS